MSNPVVKCSVDQCTHYMPGEQCMAAKISVYNDEVKGTSDRSQDTLCKAFHHRKTAGDMVGALHNANIGGSVSAAFLEGTQITPAVECFVSGCKFWENGNYCKAESIHVAGINASKTSDTDCETFKPNK